MRFTSNLREQMRKSKTSTIKSSLTDNHRRVLIKKATKLFKEKLFGVNANKVNIQVIDSRLVRDFPSNANGWAIVIEPEYYQIALCHKHRHTDREVVSTLAHEFGHIQQYMSGDLIVEEGKGITWRGALFPQESFRNSIVAQWHMRPWEIHADSVRDFLLDTYSDQLL